MIPSSAWTYINLNLDTLTVAEIEKIKQGSKFIINFDEEDIINDAGPTDSDDEET